MTAEELLRVLYSLERSILQTNDWPNLKIRVADLIAATCPPENSANAVALLQSLRLDGRLMFLPDWARWGIDEDEEDGTLVTS